MQLSQIPTKIAVPFADDGAKNVIPDASQLPGFPGKASFADGFPPATRTPIGAGGIPPAGLDMNGILYAITVVQQWQSAGCGFKYDAAFSTAIGGYPKGATLISTNSDIYWISTADDNTSDPDSVSAANWVSISNYGIGVVPLTNVNVTLNPAQYGKRVLSLTGVLTGNVVLTFPTNQQQIVVANNTTGAFTVTCRTAAGIAYAVAQGGQEMFYGDGTNLVLRLGNTPPQFDASGRIPTTAFVQKSVGNFSGYKQFVAGGSNPLTVADAGAVIVLSGAVSGSVVLPLLASFPNGQAVMIKNESSIAWTVSANAGDGLAISVANGAVASLAALQDEYVIFVSGGGKWRTFGTGILKYASGFASQLASSGYQKLPSGLILQWGTFTQADNGTAVNYSFLLPIAFPNAGLHHFIVAGQGNATGQLSVSCEGISTTTASGFTHAPTLSRAYRIFAIGY